MKGEGIGREIGFPTINFSVPDRKLLPRGVFLAKAFFKKGNSFSDSLYGACFIGNVRLNDKKETPFKIELHLLKYIENIEKSIDGVILFEKIRRVESFSGLSELKCKIVRDVKAIKEKSAKIL